MPKTILIAGGGIGGLCTASLLAAQGHRVDLFERSEEFTEIGAGIQLSPNAMQVLSKMGLYEDLSAKAFRPEFAALRDYKTGYALFRTRLGDDIEQRYGQPYLHIHRADLLEILRLKAMSAGVNFHMGHKVGHFDDDGTKIRIVTNNGSYEGDALIGADGIRSAICERLHGEVSARFTGQKAWRGTIPTSSLRKGALPSSATVWMGPKAHVVAYYIRGGEMINFVAVKEDQDWANESWVEPADVLKMRQEFEGWNTIVTDILGACHEAYLWGLFDRSPLPYWSKGRVTLLGDAAHPMLPFMAQGAAMAIEDAWVLADKLDSTSNIAAALESYQTVRKTRCSKLQSISRNNAKLYHASSLFDQTMRKAQLTIGRVFPIAQEMKLGRIYGKDVTKG